MTRNIDQSSRTRTTLAAVLLGMAAMILVTTFGVRPAEAAFPGQNGVFVYESLELSTFNYEIYAVGADGSGTTRLTDTTAEDRTPAVSPDGEKIAFASNRGGANAIYVMGVDGSNPTRITNEAGMADSYPSWSPDGEKIVFIRNILSENNPEIYVVDADGSNPTRLTESPTFDSAPAFSPDGGKIAFMSSRDGDSEIFVMGADGSNPVNLTNNTIYDAAPNWSPDGSRIAFVAGPAGSATDVFVMGSDGSGRTNLTNNNNSEYDPAFSPDGRKMVFSSDRDGDAEIYTMDAADGANATRVTDGPTLNFDPDWQPLLDTAPPAPPVITAPANYSYDTDGSITLSGKAEAGSTVRLFEGTTLKGVATASPAGAWSKTLTGVPNGRHSYTATATDHAGNASSVSAPRTVTVDTVRPAVKAVTPANGARNVAASANVTVTFSEAMNPRTVARAIKLVRSGTTAAVPAAVRYDAATRKVMLNPYSKLKAKARYTARVTTEPRDLAGNPLSAARTWSFTVKR